MKNRKQNKKIIKNMKVYFLIVNLILSTLAFSFLVNAIATPDSVQISNTNTGSGVSVIGVPPGISGTAGAITATTSTPPSSTGIPASGSEVISNTGGGVSVVGVPPGISGTSGTSGTTTGTTTGTTGTTTGVTGTTGTGSTGTNVGWGSGNLNLQSVLMKASLGAGIFATIGSLAGGDNGALWGSVAGAVGGVVAGLTENWLGPLWSTVLGVGVATIIFLLTYQKKSLEVVEFDCMPWQAPIGGGDCQLCNKFKECSEYTCKSLGQACDIINPGTLEQKCIWKNPHDVNSPIIQMTNVTKDHKFKPDPAVRPPATGVKITPNSASCIKAFTPLEFSFRTDEPAQCKIDYNLTSDPKTAFDEMVYYVGGDSLYQYTHSEKLSLPGPDAVNAIAPELKNNGEYNLYIRCRDANGNFNQDAFSVSFCVDKGPDTTPPIIVNANIPSGKPVQFNQTKLAVEIYVNEPSQCRWSRTDIKYGLMENNMSCNTNVWEMNNNLVYTCKTTLKGIKDRQDNDYFFRCKDQPWAKEGDRNENQQSYMYRIIGTQPLNIMKITPNNKTISGSTDTIPIFLEIETDNGYKDGEALCYYHQGKPSREEDFILFANTSSNMHSQRQDLVTGSYTYYFKCIDLGGNTAYNYTSFKVETDRQEPAVVRVYKENEQLKIITSEYAECSYSIKNCNFEIESGIPLDTLNNEIHTTEWKVNQNYYIRCKDSYNNQPNPNVCSIVVRPSSSDVQKSAISM